MNDVIADNIVMSCGLCKHWEVDSQCREWKRFRYGNCARPILTCTIVGDAYISDYSVDEESFCSNFEQREEAKE